MSFDKLQGPVSGLDHALDQPSASPSLAQNPTVALFPRNSAATRSEQQEAITILLDQHDYDILAYLRFARSLDEKVHHFSDNGTNGSLSSDQVLAVWVLRDCADDEIRSWLEQARKLASDPEQPNRPWPGTLQEPGSAYLSRSGQARDVLHATNAPGRRASVFAPPNVVPIEGSYQSTLDGFRLQPLQTLHNTNISHEATKAGILFWCTLCEDRHRPYKNVSDWRKHEKTHVETYYCMLRGPLEQTKGSSKCTLCGISNPSEKHLGAHNIQTCGEGVLGSFSCKRRTDLVRHLRNCHDVLGKAQGEAIADKCKETTNKQAWSCGFCGHLVHIFGDRLKHVATHFERGQTLDEWDTTKEIEGLLSQPGMVSAWQWQLAASPMGWESSEFIWKKHVVKDLQRDLEVGPADTKHAATLAKAAYEARQPRWDLLHGNMPLATAPTYGTLGPSVIVPTSNYDSITERTFEHNSNHHQSRFVANPAETLHNGVPGFGGIPMASYGYSTFPASSLEDGGSSIQTPWLLDPRQTWSSAVDQYTSINGYQEYSNATMDAPDTDEMLD